MNIFYKIFFGNCLDKKLHNTAIENQKRYLKKIWSNDHKSYFGIIRLVRLVLCVYPFFFPTLYIRHLAGKKSWIHRRIWIEIQVIFKIIFPITVLSFNIRSHFIKKIIIFLTIYFILETFLYLLSLIFLSDKRDAWASRERSIILIILNYLEITLDYAVVYKLLNLISSSRINCASKPITSLESVYFSFVTSTTIGYGDYSVKVGLGQMITILQSVTMLVFVFLFINYFIANLRNDS